MENNLPEGFEMLPSEPQQVVEPSQVPAQGATEIPEGFEPLELTPMEKLRGGAEAVAKGVISRPGFAIAQRLLGADIAEAKKREAGLGGTATALEIGAMVAPTLATLGAAGAARLGIAGAAKAIAPIATLGEFTQAGLLTKAGLGAAKKLGAEKAIATAAVAGGIENALFAAADETAKAIEGNPNTVKKAVYNVGMSGVLGTVVGGGMGAAGQLWSTKVSPKYKEFIKDFTGRVKDHASEAVPAADAVGAELQAVVNSADEATGAITGATGLKRQEIAKLLPEEADQKIINQASKAFSDVSDYLEKVVKEPGIYRSQGSRMIREYRDRMLDEITRPGATAADVFFALDNFKQQIGPLGKFKARYMTEAQKPGVEAVNDLYRQIRKNLEDETIWGAAARRQKEINRASSKFFRAADDIKRLAMTPGPEGEYVVNPDKLNTLINQVKKGKGEIKQSILNNFLDVVDDLYNTIDKIDAKFGVVSGLERPSMTASRAVTQKLTPGMKAADLVYGQALSGASTGVGGYLGYKAGQATGAPGADWLGALFGAKVLDPVVKQILPVIIKPLTEGGVTAASVRAASNLIGAVATAETISKVAADSIFLKDKEFPLPEPSDKTLEKLDKKAREIQSNPASALDMNVDLGLMLPNQSYSLNSSTMNVLSYLNQKRPGAKQNGVFDKEIPPTKQQIAAYKRTLQIAENPLMILKRVKDGTLQSSDVADLVGLYPDLYADLIKKLTMSTVTHMAEGKRVPFKTQKSLSLLTGKPLDTIFTPQSIQAAQSVFQKANVPPQQMPQMAPKSSRKSQVPEQAQTQSQRRMLDR